MVLGGMASANNCIINAKDEYSILCITQLILAAALI